MIQESALQRKVSRGYKRSEQWPACFREGRFRFQPHSGIKLLRFSAVWLVNLSVSQGKPPPSRRVAFLRYRTVCSTNRITHPDVSRRSSRRFLAVFCRCQSQVDQNCPTSWRIPSPNNPRPLCCWGDRSVLCWPIVWTTSGRVELLGYAEVFPPQVLKQESSIEKRAIRNRSS